MDRRWLLGGLLAVAGVGLVRALTARPQVTENSRVLLIGDSLAVGLHPQLKQLATDDRVPYVGSGVSGSRIDQWARSEKLRAILAEFQPTLVLVSLGTNDAYMGGDVWARQQPHMQSLLQKLAPAEVVWILPPSLPPTSLGARLDEGFLDELARAAPNPFHSEELEIPRAPDNLHPNIAGYAGWAGAIWNWLH